MKFKPLVSVIIPNLNSPLVDQVINSLLNQKPPIPLEIIIVGQDNLGLLTRFKKQKQVKMIMTSKPETPSVAKNIGIEKSSGHFLFFLDADCLVEPGWLAHLLQSHLKGPPKIVGGAIDLEKSKSFFQFCDNLSHFYAISSNMPKRETVNLASANLSLPRTIFKKVDRFDEILITGEDKDFLLRAFKAGFPLIFDPKAKVIHLPERKTFFSVLQHSFSWGENSIKVRLRHGDVEKLPIFMKNSLTLALTTPIIALATTLKIFSMDNFKRYWFTFPVIYFSKLFWCLGGVKGLKKRDV